MGLQHRLNGTSGTHVFFAGQHGFHAYENDISTYTIIIPSFELQPLKNDMFSQGYHLSMR